MSKINIPFSTTNDAASTFRPEDYGAVGNGTNDDFPAFSSAFSAAVTVAQAGGIGVVKCDPRHTYLFNSSGSYTDGGGLSLPANYTGHVILDGGSSSKVQGPGATILFSSNNYRFVDMRYVESYDTFGNVTIKGFNFNQNNVVVSTSNHVVLGHFINGNQGNKQIGGTTDSNHAYFTNITVQNCRGYNVSTSSTVVKWLWFNSIQDGPAESTQTTITAVSINNCTFTGGNVGISISGSYSTAYSSGTIGLNVYWDNIIIEDFNWSASSLATGTTSGVGVQVGNRGYGGNAKIIRCSVRWSNDIGYETDGMQSCSLYDCVAIDCWNAGYTVNNYNGSAVGNYTNPDDQIYRYTNCRYERDSLTRGRAFSLGSGGDGSQSTATGSQVGTIVYDGCKVSSNGVVLGTQLGAFVPLQTPKAIKILNCVDNYHGWSQTASGTNNYQSILIAPGNNAATARCDIDVRGYRAVVNGTATAGKPTHTALQVNSGSVYTLNVDGIMVEQSIVGIGGYTLASGIYTPVNLSAGTLDGGSIKGLVIAKTTSDDSAPKAITVGASTALTIARNLYISNCDFSQMLGASPTEVSVGDSTNKAMVMQKNNIYVNLKEPTTVTVSGSTPFVYQNLDGVEETVTVVGGTIGGLYPSIQKSTDNAVNYTSTGLLSGSFTLQPSDALRIPYTSKTSPTTLVVTKFPNGH